MTALRECLQEAAQVDALTQEIAAAYDDVHGRAATTVLDRDSAFETRSVDLDAALFLRDEFTELACSTRRSPIPVW